MALTPFRWIGALIAGCLIVAVVIFRDRQVAPRAIDMERQLTIPVERYARQASEAASRLHLAQLMDSTGVGIAQMANASSIRVFLDAAIPSEAVAALDSLAWRAVRHVADSGRVGIDVLFFYDTVTSVRGAAVPHRRGTYVDYVLPRRAGERCVAIVHVGKHATTRQVIRGVFKSDAAAEQLAGPCAFYRAFGLPGSRIDGWLRDRGWTFAGYGSWSEPAGQLDLFEEMFGRSTSPFASALLMGTSMAFFSEMSIQGVQCAAGQLEACDHALLVRRPRRAPIVWNANVLYRSYPVLTGARRIEFFRQSWLGTREPSLLAGMVQKLGRERFERFWTSNDPVPMAFEKAAGEPLNRWTARWMVAQYGEVPPRGAGVNVWSGATSLVFIVLAIGVTLRVSGRRQFA